MSRLEAKSRALYYPTPDPVAKLIADHIEYARSGEIHVIDPCAGEGRAITAVLRPASQAWTPSAGARLHAHLVELSPQRAATAALTLQTHLDAAMFKSSTVLDCGYEETAISSARMGLLFLNPPYDWDAQAVEEQPDPDPDAPPPGKHMRLEYTWLRDTKDVLAIGGVLIYIVPFHILQNDRTLHLLANNFDQLRVLAFPEEDWEPFHQLVVFGVRREFLTNETAYQELKKLCESPGELPTLDLAVPFTYTVPSTEGAVTFRKLKLTYLETCQLALQNGAYHTRPFQNSQKPEEEVEWTPLMHLRGGHIAAMVASGLTGVLNLGDMVIRGVSTKRTVAYDEEGQVCEPSDKRAHNLKDQFCTELFTLDRWGDHQVITQPGELQQILTKYAETLHRTIAAKYKPLYTGPRPEDWAKLGKLMPNKLLPGMKTAGLLPAQKHTVCAIAESCRHYHFGDMIGEMGTGKGPMSYAVVELLNAYPALVMSPAHMVRKHAREAVDTVPGAQPIIVKTPTEIEQAINRWRPGDKLIIIASNETWRAGGGCGPGWRDARLWRPRPVYEKDDYNQVVHRVIKKLPFCPHCGAPQEGSMKNKALKCTNCHAPLYVYGSAGRRWPLAHWLATYARRRNPSTGRLEPAQQLFKALIADEVQNFKGADTDQARAYHLLAQMVMRAEGCVVNATGTIFGGFASDLFFLRTRIDKNLRKDFPFTEEADFVAKYGRMQYNLSKLSEKDMRHSYGTKRRKVTTTKALPGISPAIYAIMLRTAVFLGVKDLGYKLPKYTENIMQILPEERQQDQYNWLYDTLYEEIQQGLSSYDSQSMKRAMRLLSVWLTYSLRRMNASYRTEMVLHRDVQGNLVPYEVLKGESAQHGVTGYDDEYDIAVQQATPDQKDTGDDMDTRGALKQPPCIQRNAEPMTLYPTNRLGELLPKEKWLLQVVADEKRARRRILLYVEQTGTRNIQNHLKKVLTDAGHSVAIIPEGEAAQREDWIQKHAHDVDVLITNPRKVATGLDLVHFASVIFYELPTSLFTLLQAMKRVYRLGQTQDVSMYIAVHTHPKSMEQRLLTLMAGKVRAHMLLYGETADTALAEEADYSDLFADLAKRAMKQIIEQEEEGGIVSLLKGVIDEAGENPADIEITPAEAELVAAIDETVGEDWWQNQNLTAPAAEEATPTSPTEQIVAAVEEALLSVADELLGILFPDDVEASETPADDIPELDFPEPADDIPELTLPEPAAEPTAEPAAESAAEPDSTPQAPFEVVARTPIASGIVGIKIKAKKAPKKPQFQASLFEYYETPVEEPSEEQGELVPA